MTTTTTRRTLIGGAGLAAVATAAPAIAAATPIAAADGDLLAHWEGRQQSYAQMMADGTYYDAVSLAPALMDVHDNHEIAAMKAKACTPQGALAQAWIAWEAQGTVWRDEDRARNALIHAADFDALEHLERDRELDWDDSVMLGLIRSLRALTGVA